MRSWQKDGLAQLPKEDSTEVDSEGQGEGDAQTQDRGTEHESMQTTKQTNTGLGWRDGSTVRTC